MVGQFGSATAGDVTKRPNSPPVVPQVVAQTADAYRQAQPGCISGDEGH